MCFLRYNSLKEEKKKREEEEARRRKEEEEEAARRAQEAAEVARKAQEAEEAARQEREAADAARRAQEEATRQRRAKEVAGGEAQTAMLSEQKTKEDAPELQHSNRVVIEMDGQNDGSDLAQNSKEKESQQTEAGPQHEAVLQDSQGTNEHKSLVVLEEQNEAMGAVQEANKDIALPGKSSQNTASANTTVTVSALPKTSPSVSAEDVKSPQTGSPTTNTIHPDPGRSRAPPMGKLPTSRSQEKRELRRQRGLEHSQRESVRAAAAGKDESCKELDHYTFISQKSEKPKKEADNEEEKVKKEDVTCPIRPSTLPLEVSASNEPKHTPRTKDVQSPGKNTTQPEITLKEPIHQEDKRTRTLKYGLLRSALFFCASS